MRIALVFTVIAAVAAGGGAVLTYRPWQATAPADPASLAPDAVTVPVEMATLTSQLRLNATLGYGDPVELPPSSGIITALPAAGEVIETGSALYEAEGRPVILLEGQRPFWRDLASGVSSGPDVLQLEQNLARLGFFDREPDTRFDWWTTDAINRWQKSLGLTATGTVSVADVAAVDAPSIRVSQVSARLGESAVSPLTYTETTLRAVAKLTAAQARELQAGTPVTVVLPDGTELDSTLASVDPGGQPTGDEGQTTAPSAVIEFPDQSQVEAAGQGSIRVVVSGSDEPDETLVVPVTALIATAPDGYAVEVLTREAIVRVPVTIGLVADARVQILASGPDVAGAAADAPTLSAGDEVVISR